MDKDPQNLGTDVVQLLVTEDVAREIERKVLLPFGLSLSGRMLFSADDLPTYVIDIGDKT
jgi:hypothetical protein